MGSNDKKFKYFMAPESLLIIYNAIYVHYNTFLTNLSIMKNLVMFVFTNVHIHIK